MPSALLLEWIEIENVRLPRASSLPFVAGLLEGLGWGVRWLAFPVEDRWFHRERRFVAGLPPAAIADVREALLAERFDVIVTSEVVGHELRELLGAMAPVARIVSLEDARCTSAAQALTSVVLDALGGAARSPEPDAARGLLVHDATPRYVREVRGDGILPGVGVTLRAVGTSPCVYVRRVSDNPCYAGVEDESVTSHRGCAFCGFHVGTRPGRAGGTDWVDLALRQVEAFERDAPAAPGDRRRVLFDDVRVARNVERILPRLLASARGPMTWAICLRVDEAPGFVRSLEPFAQRVMDGDHRFELVDLGLENFSNAENARFNKGYGAEAVWTAIAALEDFQARHPGVVAFRRDKSFSAILFTPWTTVDDLLENVVQGERLGPEWLRYALGTRLQIVEGRAIAALARRDGALCAAFDDAVEIDAVCLTESDRAELPWRFLDARTARLHALLVRLEPLPRTLSLPANDASYAHLARARAALPVELDARHARLVAAFVHAVAALGAGASLEALVGWIREHAQAWLDEALPPRGLSRCEALLIPAVVSAFVERHGQRFGGLSVERAEPIWSEGRWRVDVSLRRGGRALALTVQRRLDEHSRAWRAGTWALVTDRAEGPATTADAALGDALVKVLERYVVVVPPADLSPR
jgi:hypothetical protein